MFLWFFMSALFAHQPIGHLSCTDNDQTIEISEQAANWIVRDSATGKKQTISKPKSKDVWDKKQGQLFDVYVFELNQQSYELKLPEGPGPITKIHLMSGDKTWTCRSSQK